MTEIYLAFDIETIPQEYESFSESQQEYLVRFAETEEEIERKKSEMALSPLTAQVVVIGLQLVELDNGEIVNTKKKAFILDEALADGEEITGELSTGDEFTYFNEKTMLLKFWEIFTKPKYSNSHLISFNGRNFDAPFLMLRSALLCIRPSRNLMSGTKFNYGYHTDLIDELTFYTPSSYGATKRFNFDFYTRAFGLVSPKSDGIDGSKVKDYFIEGKKNEIAEYCLRDVVATWELFLIWKERLKF
jgi:hypothetical protein